MKQPNQVVDALLKALCVVSLCLLFLIYGVLAGHNQWFPSQPLREAQLALDALQEVATEPDDSRPPEQTSEHSGPVVVNHAGSDDGALILMTGGPNHLGSLSPAAGCIAWLMDRAGTVKHVWPYPRGLWRDLQIVKLTPGVSRVYPLDVHLLDDGGLVVSFQVNSAMPYAVGLVRLDADSNVIWKHECLAHHWFEVTDDGRILSPGLRLTRSPRLIGHTIGRIVGPAGVVFEDVIMTVSLKTGKVLETLSVFEAAMEAGWIGLYQGANGNAMDFDVATKDPLHLNDVKRVSAEAAAGFDWLEPDDLLLSFRSINTVAILDPHDERFKWWTTGTTLRQHSPRILGNGEILVFDNAGGSRDRGMTRLAQIDLESGRSRTVFPTGVNELEGPVATRTAGHLDLRPDGKAVLMAVTHQSRVYEIDPASGRLLWEYLCIDPATRRALPVYSAKYVYDVPMPLNQETQE